MMVALKFFTLEMIQNIQLETGEVVCELTLNINQLLNGYCKSGKNETRNETFELVSIFAVSFFSPKSVSICGLNSLFWLQIQGGAPKTRFL